jgi:hypothetical protein
MCCAGGYDTRGSRKQYRNNDDKCECTAPQHVGHPPMGGGPPGFPGTGLPMPVNRTTTCFPRSVPCSRECSTSEPDAPRARHSLYSRDDVIRSHCTFPDCSKAMTSWRRGSWGDKRHQSSRTCACQGIETVRRADQRKRHNQAYLSRQHGRIAGQRSLLCGVTVTKCGLDVRHLTQQCETPCVCIGISARQNNETTHLRLAGSDCRGEIRIAEQLHHVRRTDGGQARRQPIQHKDTCSSAAPTAAVTSATDGNTGSS